ncbi:MAG: hypothetical protein ABSH48_03690 [Verrucomicrobiota bacterium]|jgi:uncharacterized protein YceK
MKMILFLLTLGTLVLTGCQTVNDHQAARTPSGQIDWTYGGGAIGLP